MRIRRVFFLLVSGLFFFQAATAGGGPVIGPEYEVKIGFIYNFANFIAWPPAAFENNPDSLTFCFASDVPTSEVFFKLEGKTIKGRKIKVIAYQDSTSLDRSQILFFPTQNKDFIQKILDLAAGRGILTIGEVEGFTQMGGVINFFQERNRLRFEVNIDAVRREKLKMSSQLLGSAQIVKDQQE
jgi:hypothetical protein